MSAGWSCGACERRNPAATRFCGWCGARRLAEPGISDDVLTAALLEAAGGGAAERVAEGADVLDERRLVTSLFADVSGFTTLADLLEPEELHEVMSPVIAGMAAVAERYEGFIAKYAGDALLVFFGAPVAHEDDASRALLVALEMHEALPELVRELPEEARDLSLHIGVSTGRVVSGRFGGEARSDYSILGDAVIVAQRLESVAGSGETYVGQSTYELTRDEFRFESLGELTLKGKLRPVPAYRLLGRRRVAAFSGVSVDRPSMPLVGRDAELAAVWQVLDRLDGGRGGAVGLVAEPGVGKSRLVAEVREQAREAGARWYQARCLSYGASLPYWPFADLVRQVAGVRADEPDAVVLPRLREVFSGADRAVPYLAVLLGLSEGTEEVRGLDPDAFRRGLHSAAREMLSSLADGAPIVLAIEDLHWADPSSVALAAEVAAASPEIGLALVATARPEGEDALRGVLLPADGALVPVLPLGPEATEELIAHLLGSDPPHELVGLVRDRAGGNPLFVEELVRSFHDRGLLTERNGRWRLRVDWAEEEVPATVERVLASRIDLLSPAAAAALQLAAVAGRVVPEPLAEALLDDLPEADRGAVLDELLKRGLLEHTVYLAQSAFMFHHALVQEVAYGRLMPKVRRELHRRVAEVTERLYGSSDDVIELLARHLYLGEAGVRAAEALRQAAARAVRLYATEEAVLHLTRAAEVAEAKGEILGELAEQQAVRGDYDEALRLYEAATQEGAGLRSWSGRAATLRRVGEYDAAVTTVDEALRTADKEGLDVAALWLERGWALSVAGDVAGAVDALEAGLAAAGEHEAPVVGQLLTQLGRAEAVRGNPEAGLARAEEALALFERIGDLRGVTSALRVVGNAHGVAERHDLAAAALRRAIDLAGRTGTVEELAGSLMNLGTTYVRSGAVDDAVETYGRAVAEFERIDHGSGQAVGYGNLADALLQAGRLDEAERYCEKALEKAAAIGHAPTVAEATHTLAELRVQQGRPDDAVALARDAATRFADMGADDRVAACEELVRRAF